MRVRRLCQKRQAGLRTQKRAAHVDAKHQVEAFGGRLRGAGKLDRAGIVDKDIDAAEMRGSLLHSRIQCRLIAHVELDGQRLAASRRHFGGHRVNGTRQLRVRCRRFCGDDDIGAVACAAQRNSAADAAAGAGNEYGLAPQLAHQRPRLSCSPLRASASKVTACVVW